MIISSEHKRKIVVGINSLVSTTQPAYSNHIQFFFRLGRNYPNIDFILVNPSRMGIDRMRNLCAKTAIECDADYILFLDDDVLIPIDSFQYLMEADADIVAGDVLIRGYPFNHMAFRYPLISDKIDNEGTNLKAIAEWREIDSKLLTDVDAVGFSYCLLKVSTLKKIPGPWFLTGPRNTEDIYYCMKAKLYVPNISIKVCTNVVCEHILWAETISAANRDHYRKYMEEQWGYKPESLLEEKPRTIMQEPLCEDTGSKNDYAAVVQADQDQFQFKFN